MTASGTDAQVVVVGAGPVGLCAALELGTRGVRTTVFDLVADLAEKVHPRARVVNLRTTEHLRRWGVSDAVRAHTPFGVDWPSTVEFRTSLAGYLIASFPDAQFSDPERSALYPEPSIQVRQTDLERAVREKLATLANVETVYGAEVVELAEVDGGVRVVARKGADVIERVAEYVVGADGGRSIVRRTFGFELIGQSSISQNVQILFDAPGLYDALGLEPGMQYWCLNAEFPGFVQTTSPDDQFLLSLHKLGDRDAFIANDVERAVRSAIGSDYPFTVTGIDPWTIHARIADSYRKGRAFLIGDAARQHSTYGGHGMNVGVSDAADIGWKLAAVLRGISPTSLLDTFTIERKPIGEVVLDQATNSFSASPSRFVRPGMETPGPEGDAIRDELRTQILREKASQFRHIGTQLGYSYAGSPIVVGDGTVGPEWTPNEYVVSASPGHIAPHAWLEDGISLYDRFGRWYTLLDLGDVPTAADGTPPRDWLEIVSVPSSSLRELYAATFVIVRPDQHVAWRGDRLPTEDVLHTITGARITDTIATA